MERLAALRALRLFFGVMALAGASAAQPEPTDAEKRSEAKQHFLSGIELVRAGDWDAALAEFLASRALYPTKVALSNAAISLSQLKRYSEALAMYHELVAKFGTAMTADERRAVDNAIGELSGRVGRLVLSVDPAGANVVIDNRERGKAPLPRPVEVDAGTHAIRVWKSGYETHESSVLVAGKETKSVVVELATLRAAGILTVAELGSRTVDVVVDGAVVGRAPWTGTLAPGTHSVTLRGAGNLGTPPTTARVKNGETTTLRLRAIELDSSLRVEPTPANAQVIIDGVSVGNGAWEGRLASGNHRVEVVAPGFVAHRGQIRARTGKAEVQRIELERDLSSPLWTAGFAPHIYLEAVGGLAAATSFGGGADAACAGSSCERSRPLGFLAGARGGYEAARGFGVELFLGALYLRETTKRPLTAAGEAGDFVAPDYQDSTTLFGPAAAVSASARFLDETPLTFRAWAGIARVNASFDNRGTFTGDVVYQPPSGPSETGTTTQSVSIPEQSSRIWMPFVGPEVRMGYRLSKRLSADLGVAVLVAFPPDTPRTGLTNLSRSEGERKTDLSDVTLPTGHVARGGVLSLPREDGFGTIFCVIPSAALRFDL